MLNARLITLFLMISTLSGCVTPPATDQRSQTLISASREAALGEEIYREILKKEKISQDLQLIAIVERVGQQIAAVSPMPHLNWEFKLIESGRQKAFVLPGGKVIIYTGLLPVCANEAGLAAVMGHLAAHTFARHGAQRMPQTVHLTGVPAKDSVSLSDPQNREAIMSALGAGSAVGATWPFSPDNELEADEIGLNLMSQAGYDPREAQRFWARFIRMKQGNQIPEILSTHPMDATRIEGIRRLLPKVLRVYKSNPLQHDLGQSFLILLNQRKFNPKPASPVPGP